MSQLESGYVPTGDAEAERVKPEGAAALVVLAAMCLLPLSEIAARKAAGRGIAGAIPVVQHLTLWITMLGGVLAAGSDRMLAMSTGAFLPARLKEPVRIFTSLVCAAISASLALASGELVRVQCMSGEQMAWGIPAWCALGIMPLGFAWIAAWTVERASESRKGRLAAAFGLVVPAVFAAAPDSERGLLAGLAFAAAGAALVLGLPIFAALGGAAMLLFWRGQSPVASVPFDFYRLAAHPILPAIPLFTLAGYILSEGGASRRLLRTFQAVLGWMPGGLAAGAALVLAFFTPLTGASGVTILSMGGLLLPVLRKAGYPEGTSLGLVTVSGSIGLLLPPSLPVILYAITARQPIDDLFVAGLAPGILLVAVVAGWGAWRGWRFGAARTPFRLEETAGAVWESKWELLLPAVVLFSYFGGFATLVETAALTVIYGLIVECLVYRDLGWTDLRRLATASATMAGGFLIILGVALGFTNYLIHEEIPMKAIEWVRAHVESRVVFLLALNGFLVIVGALMDIYSAIFVVAPLVVPMGAAYGVDPVHLGIIFLANMELGYLMPPMGENLFLSSYRFAQPLSRVYAATVPFLIVLAVTVLVVTYVPGMTLALPSRWR